jgi:hypothetical protein
MFPKAVLLNYPTVNKQLTFDVTQVIETPYNPFPAFISFWLSYFRDIIKNKNG